MNVHEYQAKEILRAYEVPIPEFGVARSAAEAEAIWKRLDLAQAVVKIQVHAGGRGKAGGVKFAKSLDELHKVCKQLIGMKMVNNQTGPEGVVAHAVMVSRPVDIVKEYYLGAVVDRAKGTPILIASPEGGVEIEETDPEKILQVPFGEGGKIHSYHLLRLEKFMGWGKAGGLLAQKLARCFWERDCAMLEINPLVGLHDGSLTALDAKMSVDDNALFRQPEIAAMFDPTQVSPQEAAAKKYDLAYIQMPGNIACMVNGAGLAMATMDIIQVYGGTPANFLDVGGSATKEKIGEGFRILLSDSKVRALFINIFGGIMNCATLADGVLHAARELKVSVPIVVRMEGTNVEEGKRLFQESGLKIATAATLAEAAKLAVEYAHSGR